MEIGLGLDSTLNLSWKDQTQLSMEAANLGYTSLWTPEGTGHDSFQLSLHRWAATCNVIDGGLTTGISVSPVMYRTPVAFAMAGGTVSDITHGKFIMGIGSGGTYRPRTRKALGMPNLSTLELMKDYLITTMSLLHGNEVKYAGETVTLEGTKLGITPPPRTPVYLGSLGPKMLNLAGEFADGACLNWCSPEQVEWSRKQIIVGAKKASRDPSQIKLAEYIRICVDDDEDTARIAFAKATMGYALGDKIPSERERQMGYRAHFERMGFTDDLAELDKMRRRGATQDELAEAFPANLLKTVGYYGTPQNAMREFKRIGSGLDTAIVRVVAAKNNIDSVRAVMRACAPNQSS